MTSPENKVSEVESEINGNKAETLSNSPEEESIEEMQERMANEAEEAGKKMLEYSSVDEISEKANENIGLSEAEVKMESEAMGLDAQLEEINIEAKEAKDNLAHKTAAVTPEKPPVPPLKETEELSVADQEKLEQELKLKTEKYNKLRDRVVQENEAKANSSENPVNKLDEQEAKLLCKLAGGGRDFEQTLKKNGLDEEKLLAIMPDLYKRGKISNEDYAMYITMQSYEGNKLNVGKVNRIIQNTPKEIIMGSAQVSPQLGGILTEWRQRISEEVKGHLEHKRTVGGVPRVENPEAALKLAANIARFVEAGKFPDKEIIQAGTKTIVEDFTKSYLNYNRLADPVGSMRNFHAVENLYQAGFPEEAAIIIIISLKNGAMSPHYVTELQVKGYLVEDEARDILDAAGMLRG